MRSGVDPLCSSWLVTIASFCIICEYGELGSCDFLAMTKACEKLVLINPGLNQVTGYKIANNKGDIENDPCRQCLQTDWYIERAEQSNIFRNLLLFVSNANNH